MAAILPIRCLAPDGDSYTGVENAKIVSHLDDLLCPDSSTSAACWLKIEASNGVTSATAGKCVPAPLHNLFASSLLPATGYLLILPAHISTQIRIPADFGKEAEACWHDSFWQGWQPWSQ